MAARFTLGGAGRSARRRASRIAAVSAALLPAAVALIALHAQEPPRGVSLSVERALAGTVSEGRMVETVRRLVSFGPRMYGTPSNHEAAAWLAGAFREAGLDVVVRADTPRAWYQPVSWEVRVSATGSGGSDEVLRTTWPSLGAPASRGDGLLSIDAAPGAVCLVSANPTPETTTGCAAGRASAG
ncbi:MAG: hypothetical protein AB1806_15740 [Acidobacteriota bacterium]